MTNLPKDIASDAGDIIHKYEFSHFDFGHIDEGQPFLLDYEAGNYMQNKFVNLIFKTLPYFALTEQEFSEYKDYSTEYINEKALNRIVRPGTTAGDYGEITLFLLLEIFYGSKKLVTKVKYKTPGDMPVFGSDTAHFTEENDGEIVLWFGEAKFYVNFSSALDAAFKSVTSFLKAGVKKEIEFLTPDKIEINKNVDSELWRKVINIIDSKKSLDSLGLKIPVLIMYECSSLGDFDCSDSCEFQNLLKNEFENKFDKIKERKWVKEYFKNLSFVFFLLPIHDVKSMKNIIRLKDDGRRS